jgi:hypothetical protein
MAELSSDPDLVQEALSANGRGQVRPHHLEGDEAIMAKVAGQVDSCHSTFAQLALDGVATSQSVLDLVDNVRQSEC